MAKSDEPDYNLKVYNNNPVLFKSYVNKHVTITTDSSNVYNGIVYTIDPVSESIVLLEQCEDNKFNAKIVMGHCVKKIELTTNLDGLDLPELFPSAQNHKTLTGDKLSAKKKKIKEILMENCLPVVDNNGVLEVEGMFSIEPPYEKTNCICHNSIILSRITKMLYENNER